ncbi:MAG: hypothetical protein QM757_01330 [Paludibaculum sp.]
MSEWVFLFEESLGRFIPEEFARATHAHVKRHSEAFPYGREDHEWIPMAARRGWVIVSKDKRIRSRPLEYQALLASKARFFYLRYGDLTKEASAEAFITAYPKMLKILDGTHPPFIARISPSGAVEIEGILA